MLPEKPKGVSTYDWETGETTYDVTQMDAGQRWRCAISQATEAARKRFPHSADRTQRAHALVSEGKVVLHPTTGGATVMSTDGTQTYRVKDTCECPDASRAPEGWCKHALAVAILKKALVLVEQFKAATAPVTLTAQALETEEVDEVEGPEIPALEPVTSAVRQLDPAVWPGQEESTGEPVEATEPACVAHAEVVPSVPRIPREFLYDNHGTPAILWGGLLHMAHQAGMYSMVVDVVTVTPGFAVMRATARFNDGGVWSDVGDSTPDNVGKKVQASFIRMASTRAMARVVRTALDVPYLAACELPDSDDIAD